MGKNKTNNLLKHEGNEVSLLAGGQECSGIAQVLVSRS